MFREETLNHTQSEVAVSYHSVTPPFEPSCYLLCIMVNTTRRISWVSSLPAIARSLSITFNTTCSGISLVVRVRLKKLNCLLGFLMVQDLIGSFKILILPDAAATNWAVDLLLFLSPPTSFLSRTDVWCGWQSFRCPFKRYLSGPPTY